jgi:hypothetical protein
MVKTRGSKGREYISSPQKSSRTPARKLKDKVGSPAARASRGLAAKAVASSAPTVADETNGFSSDEFYYSDEDEHKSRSASPIASDSATSQTSVGSRTKLPLNLQLTLLNDIQSAGGIEKFQIESHQALSELCDKRPELYGARGGNTRLRIGRKVARWKQLEKDQWLQLLLHKKVSEKTSKTSTITKKSKPEALYDTKPASVPFEIPAVITSTTFISKPAATKMVSTKENTRK